MGKYRNITEVKAANKARGHSFFSPEWIRFFDSRVYPVVYNGRYFITSEQFHGSVESLPRRYSIRRVEDDGSISKVPVGDKHAVPDDSFPTKEEAIAVAKKLLDHETPCANCRQYTYNPNFTCRECQELTK